MIVKIDNAETTKIFSRINSVTTAYSDSDAGLILTIESDDGDLFSVEVANGRAVVMTELGLIVEEFDSGKDMCY